jgi:diguanylate cyclase (GGDEF)-like protein/PAS domain S-box-containing protein
MTTKPLNSAPFNIWLIQLGIALLYVLLGLVVRYYVVSHGTIGIVWPGSGLALAAVLIFGRRSLLGVMSGSLLLNLILNDSPWNIVSFTLSNVLEALLGSWLLTRHRRSALLLNKITDFLRLIVLGGGIACLPAAMLGALGLLLSGAAAGNAYLENLLHWWMADILGVILVTPLILSWWRAKFSRIKFINLLEGFVLIGLTLLVGQMVFLDLFREYFSDTPKGYWMFLFVTLVAMRMGVRGATLVVLLITIQAISGASRQIGFFAHDLTRADLDNFWAYISILSLVGMSLATYVKGLTREIAERKVTEKSLIASEQRYHILFDNNPMPMWVIEENSLRFLEVNDCAIMHYGYTREEFCCMTLRDIRPAEDVPVLDRMISQSPDRRAVGEWRHQKKDGTIISVQVNTVPMLYGDTPARIALIQDITERKNAELALHRENEKNRALLHNASDGIHILDTAGNIIEVSNSFCVMLGYQREELIGKHVSLWDSNFSEEELEQVIKQQFLKEERSQFETRHRCKDGTVIDVEVSGFPLELDSRKVLFNSSRDITERKRLQFTLQQQLLFSNALNQIAKTIVAHNEPDLILDESARIVGEALAADRALIYDVSFDKHKIIGMSQWLNPLHPEITSTKATYSLDVFSGGSAELRRSKSFLVSHFDDINPHLLADGSGQLLHHDKMIKSLLWYPFAFREDGFYSLVLNQTQVRKEWSGLEIDFLHSVSQMVSVELEKIRLMAESLLAETQLRIAAIAFESQEGMLITDADSRILRVNHAFTAITGYQADEVLGKNPSILHSGRHDESFYASMWDKLKINGAWEGEIWNRRKNGEDYPEYLTITAVKDEGGNVKNYVGTLTDITELKQHQQEIEHLAYHDPLTQLPNRTLLSKKMRLALEHAKQFNESVCLACLDLDGFKLVNDTYGHEAGDRLLVEAGNRMLRCVRANDTVSRLGGDEFVLVLCGISANSDCERTLGRILKEMIIPFDLGDGNLAKVSGSIGYTLYPEDDADPDTLLRHADHAMYSSKQAGKNRFQQFDLKQDARTKANWQVLERMEKALVQEEFRLYIQPKINLNTGQVAGAEALIRWLHPLRGIVPPNEFLPLIENQDIALKVGLWVIREGMNLLNVWHQQGLQLPLSVNVCARQLREHDFTNQLNRILKSFPLVPPNHLEIEIVESAALDDIHKVSKIIENCHKLGVHFSLDDFGTGYSSLTYLKRLSVDTLKIDQSFVRDMLQDESALSIVRGVIALAQAFRRNTVAEGVESWQHATQLKMLGCEIVQGYAIARPMPAEEFPDWVTQFRMPEI